MSYSTYQYITRGHNLWTLSNYVLVRLIWRRVTRTNRRRRYRGPRHLAMRRAFRYLKHDQDICRHFRL
jgi:hypothetical protein